MRLKTGRINKVCKTMLSMQVAMVIVALKYPDILKSFIAKLLNFSKK
jgi:hypothetical protein